MTATSFCVKRRHLGFAIVSLVIFIWIQSWLRLYPSWLYFLLQTLLIFFGIDLLLRWKRRFWSGAITAILFGWLASISCHQLLSFVFIDNFSQVWQQRQHAGSIWQHIWFVGYSSLLFAGPIQAFACYATGRRAAGES